MSLGKECHACHKSLGEVRGPELMDHEGRTFHLTCWCKMMDARAEHLRQLDALHVNIVITKELTRRVAKQLPPSSAEPV
jgi:hypothetical protein